MKRKIALFGVGVLLVLGSSAQGIGESLTDKIKSLIEICGYHEKQVGVYVKDIGKNTLLAAVNGEQPYNPASVTKLVTAACAFEQLGTTAIFPTTIFAEKHAFARDSGVVHGNLWVCGHGDPFLTAERMWLLARTVLNAGIRKVEGNIILDDFFFDTMSVGPGFDEESGSRAYDAPVGALSASFNSIAVLVAPGDKAGSPARIEIFPSVKKAMVTGTIKTVGQKIATACDAATEECGGVLMVHVSGTIAVDDKQVTIYRKAWSTWQHFGGVFGRSLEECGVIIAGTFVHGKTPDSLLDMLPLAEMPSQPLGNAVTDMFKYSSNFTAEMLFKTISALADSSRNPGSWKSSRMQVVDWWKSSALPGIPVIANGSGMGDTNRLSPLQTVALLERVWRHKEYLPEYLNALPSSGIDGTLKKRFKKSPLKGMVRAKTGTLNDLGISTLAGYVLDKERVLAFAVYIRSSGKSQTEAWSLQEKIVEMAAESP